MEGMKHDYLLIVALALIITIGIILLIVTGEGMIQDLYGEEIQITEQCRLENGQVMIGELCERKIKCLNTGLLLKSCEELQND